MRAPGELLPIAVTLAIGVGGVCAASVILYAVLLQPLPFPEPDRLVLIWESGGASDLSGRLLSDLAFEKLRDEHSGLESVAMYAPAPGRMSTSRIDAAKRLRGLLVSGDFFEVLRRSPVVGRALAREDERLEADPVIVVSDRLRLAGVVEGRINEQIRLDGVTHTIVGVMASSFQFPDPETGYWIPLVPRSSILEYDPSAVLTTRSYRSIGRLAAGASPAAAKSQANAIVGSSGDAQVEIRSYLDELSRASETLLAAPAKPRGRRHSRRDDQPPAALRLLHHVKPAHAPRPTRHENGRPQIGQPIVL